MTALGGPDAYLFGNLTICGTEGPSDPGDLGATEPVVCGPSEAQQRLVSSVHAAVLQEAMGGRLIREA
ncbi:hypothetical protein [Streptomyces collinus]|uniref:hypothetical protein n=1 Tax=Streptomyces collinus TaxID=42684 RepID=UPI0036E17087